MLISLSKKFIFIANLKTASTSIEEALAPYAEIHLTRSEWGKHRALSALEAGFPEVFAETPLSRFFVFGVIREPADWLRSLYRSHKGVSFEATELSTMDMTFARFVDEWIPAHQDQVMAQTDKFVDAQGVLAVDFLMRFDCLPRDFANLCTILGLPQVALGALNRSVDIDAEAGLDEARAARIRDLYRRDYFAYEKMASRLPAEASAIVESAGEAVAAEPLPRPKLTRDDVIWAYRYILGREPESEDVIGVHLNCADRGELRAHMLESEEFSNKYAELRGAPSEPPDAEPSVEGAAENP